MKKYIKIIGLCLALIVTSCAKKEECKYDAVGDCGGNGKKPMVDLVILIDTSGSMSTIASSVSNEAASAISDALKNCDSDLRITYLGLDGGFWPGTNFTTDSRTYLQSLYGSPITFAADRPFKGYIAEQGANGIEDISKYFDWRPGACRAIFYISDEELDSILPIGDIANEDAETNAAIVEAKKNKVAVFANYLTYQGRGPSILQNYTDLTSMTGGVLFTTSLSTLPTNYYSINKVFDDIVCNACNGCN